MLHGSRVGESSLSRISDGRSIQPVAQDPVDVSVLTPSFGYGRFIRDAILSVQAQTGVSVEHIVQDGGSTDETLAVLREFDGVVNWRSEPDHGQSDALNRALSRGNGQWVGWLNADEFYLPGGLARLVASGNESAVDVVYGDAVFVDAEGRFLRLLPAHSPNRLTLRWYGPYVESCAAIVRRSILEEAPWNPDLRRIMDWDLYLRLDARGARFLHVPYPVGAFRVHQDRVTAQPRTVWESHSHTFRLHGVGSPAMRRLVLRSAGRAMHRLQKLMSGSYSRQARARELKGTDFRWFSDDGSAGPKEAWSRLLRSCY
jgi:glycosyltransferase involved in cell wall biosynthesis